MTIPQTYGPIRSREQSGSLSDSQSGPNEHNISQPHVKLDTALSASSTTDISQKNEVVNSNQPATDTESNLEDPSIDITFENKQQQQLLEPTNPINQLDPNIRSPRPAVVISPRDIYRRRRHTIIDDTKDRTPMTLRDNLLVPKRRSSTACVPVERRTSIELSKRPRRSSMSMVVSARHQSYLSEIMGSLTDTKRSPIIPDNGYLSSSTESSFIEDDFISTSRFSPTTARKRSVPKRISPPIELHFDSYKDVWTLILNQDSAHLDSKTRERAIEVCMRDGQLYYKSGRYHTCRATSEYLSSRDVSRARYILGELLWYRYMPHEGTDCRGPGCKAEVCRKEQKQAKWVFELANVEGRRHYGALLMLVSIHAGEFIAWLCQICPHISTSGDLIDAHEQVYKTLVERPAFKQWFKRSANLNGMDSYRKGLIFEYEGVKGLSGYPKYAKDWTDYRFNLKHRKLNRNALEESKQCNYNFHQRDLIESHQNIDTFIRLHDRLCGIKCKEAKGMCQHGHKLNGLKTLLTVLESINICPTNRTNQSHEKKNQSHKEPVY